jgi:hypothetical protein
MPGLLAIYLNDHFAGSSFAIALIRRSLRSNRGSELGEFLERFSGEVLEDRATLERLMDAVGASKSPVKPLLARAAERAGRLKLNGRLRGYSPLSRVLELEALVAGVTGKRAMWRLLRLSSDPRLQQFDFDELERRAERQLDGLEQHRLAAARAILPGAGAAG